MALTLPAGVDEAHEVDSEVVALLGLFVVLVGQDGADQPGDRTSVGEDFD